MNNTIENYINKAEEFVKNLSEIDSEKYYILAMNVIDAMADLIEDEDTVVYIPINENSLLVVPEEDRIYVPIFTDKSLCKEHTEEIIAKAVFNIVSDDQDFSGVVVNPGHQSTFVFEG